MMCGAADEGSAALFVCGGEGRIGLRRRGTCRTDGRGGIGGRMMTCGRRWIEEPRLFDRKSDDFPSQSLLTSGLDGRPSSSLHCLPRVHHPHAADANVPVCAAGATTPEPDPGVGGREDGLDLPGGQIGVRLLCVEGESVLEDGERGWIRPEGESA